MLPEFSLFYQGVWVFEDRHLVMGGNNAGLFFTSAGICSKICHKATECVSIQLNESTEAIINERYREIFERYYQGYEPINSQ